MTTFIAPTQRPNTDNADDSPSGAIPGNADRRYAELVRRIKTAKLLDRRSGVYTARIVATFALGAIGWAAFFILGNSWWQLATAAFLAFAFAQIGFLAHDAGHRQAFRSVRANDILMLASANLSIGVASGWWFGNHKRHHAHPNNTDLDPDVQLRIFAYSSDQSTQKAGIDKFIARYQHFLYFPLLCFLGFTLHIESAAAVLGKRVSRPRIEGALLLVGFVAYVTPLLFVLSPVKLIAFVALNQMLFGLYLGSTFAPNHKGMEMFSGNEPTFLDRQVISSRNVRGGALMSYLLGGLNYQIEHHLFPSMPRPNLRRARPIVKSFCEEVGLPYAERSLFGSFGEVIRHFRSTRTTA